MAVSRATAAGLAHQRALSARAMLRARLRLLLFAVALNLAVCAADYGERSKNHEEYKEKLADWEADGGWNHDKYQR